MKVLLVIFLVSSSLFFIYFLINALCFHIRKIRQKRDEKEFVVFDDYDPLYDDVIDGKQVYCGKTIRTRFDN